MNTYIVFILGFLLLSIPGLYSQNTNHQEEDSLVHEMDTVYIDHCCDSLNMFKLEYKQIQQEMASHDSIIKQLKNKSLELNQQILSQELNIASLQENNQSLNNKATELESSLRLKDELLQKQIKALEEKEELLSEKEAIYKEAMYSKKIDSLELAAMIREKNMLIEGKMKELELLEKDIAEKESSITVTSSEMEKIKSKVEKTENELVTLREKNTELQVDVTKKDKDIEQLNQKISFLEKDVKRTKKELDNCINKDKRKKVRVVQGIAFKSFRAPQYELAPKDVDNTNVYVINNKNSGNFELDYITGASIKLLDIKPEKFNKTTDLSLFIGFGGKDLFKNFYFGPNIMLYNVIHINLGINFREYEVLKSGFEEGDIMPIGTPIPTNNQWKVNGYLGLTLDLNVFSSIAKKG